jgi:hypothetical protein
MFDLECIVRWGINCKKNLLLEFTSICDVSCPCCRTIIQNNIIKFAIFSKLINQYKYIIIGFIILFLILLYFLYNCVCQYPIETVVMLYYISNILIAFYVEKLCDYYNIILYHPYFDDDND